MENTNKTIERVAMGLRIFGKALIWISVIAVVAILIASLAETFENGLMTTLIVTGGALSTSVAGAILIGLGYLVELAGRMDEYTKDIRSVPPAILKTYPPEDMPTFAEWAEKNPGKTRNDYYAVVRKK